jgi:hypothetical protein
VSATVCGTCGAPRLPNAAFCNRCGSAYDLGGTAAGPASAPAPPPPAAATAPPPPAAATADPGTGQIQIDPGDLKRRAKEIWFPLVLLGIMGYFDYLAYGNIVAVVLIGGISLGVILFRKEIAAKLNLGQALQGVPRWARQMFVAVPAMLWFVIRGQGTSGAGIAVMLLTLAIVAAIGMFGPAIDAKLSGFYAGRNRVLPKPVRMVLAIVLPILVGFWVVHGTLKGLPVLFFGTTSSPAYASDRLGLFLLSTFLSAAIAFLLLREARSDAP